MDRRKTTRRRRKNPKNINAQQWFNVSHLHKHPSVFLKDLHGYVLPHAGTKYTGNIISHTLRFKPKKKFNRVVIIYLPSSKKPNINYKDKEYYHEYFVPWKSFQYFLNTKVSYVGINVLDQSEIESYDKKTIYILSADFSHFLPFQQAIELENKAAKSMMFRNFTNTNYNKIIDDLRSFHLLNKIIPNYYHLQWIGRTRSPGLKGVGYLSFLIRDTPKPKKDKPNGIFVTLYDKKMNTRECLGEWFTPKKPWSKLKENNLIQKVINSAQRGTRFTDKNNKYIPLTNYTITYLYKIPIKKMIRGWHGILRDAFFLPDVFLEHTHTNGKWIQGTDSEWMKGAFSLSETLRKLRDKAGLHNRVDLHNKYTLFKSSVIHVQL